MFDELIRELRRLEGTQHIPVSISYEPPAWLPIHRRGEPKKLSFFMADKRPPA